MTTDRFLAELRNFLVRAPSFRGKSRITNFLRGATSGTPRTIRIFDFGGRLAFDCDLAEHISGQIFWNGAYSIDQLWVVDAVLPVNGVFLDVGANQGEFTVYGGGIATAGRVLAFEPMLANLEKLRNNVAINHFGNVSIFPVALGEKEGKGNLFTDPTKAFSERGANSGIGSLIQSETRSSPIGETTILTLDLVCEQENLSRVDLIKIDVEGGELAVLKGALATLQKFRPQLLVELNQDALRGAGTSVAEVVALLERVGYSGYLLTDKQQQIPLREDSLPTFGNALFVPRAVL